MRPLFGSFGDNCRITDVDGVIERRGRFLVFETKPPGGQPPPVGQMRALQALARLPQFTVAIVWGQPDEPEMMQVLPGLPRPCTSKDLWEFAAQWWCLVNEDR